MPKEIKRDSQGNPLPKQASAVRTSSDPNKNCMICNTYAFNKICDSCVGFIFARAEDMGLTKLEEQKRPELKEVPEVTEVKETPDAKPETPLTVVEEAKPKTEPESK